jgi:hypothetical protein
LTESVFLALLSPCEKVTVKKVEKTLSRSFTFGIINPIRIDSIVKESIIGWL